MTVSEALHVILKFCEHTSSILEANKEVSQSGSVQRQRLIGQKYGIDSVKLFIEETFPVQEDKKDEK